MKTSKLTGALLDYWSAKALGDRMARIVGAEEHERCETRFGSQWPWDSFSPSRAWMYGGQIIEQLIDRGYTFMRTEPGGPVRSLNAFGMMDGRTVLECAARTLVAEKFGPDVPDSTE